MEIPDVLDHAADRPIHACKDDVLGRCSFAKAVAKGIAGRVGKESYVIGLFGPWGSGKSSVKNMIVETLQSDKATCPIIVEFNPWQFKDAEQLTQAFFNETAATLETTIINSDKSDEAKRSAAKWKQLGSALSVGGDILTNTAKIVDLAGVPIAGIVLRGAGVAAKSAGGAVKEGSSTMDAPVIQSLTEIKKELRKAMLELDRPVLVVLDDIDRLSAAEMPLIFQLVKANGDFPNLVYLLLFQRDIVEASLNKIAPKESGADYLEKIIQLPLNLPAINRTQLFELMKPDLVRILGQEGFNKITEVSARNVADILEGKSGWYFQEAILPYFETVRDVRRFINTLEFQTDILRKDGMLQANAADLMAMEVLRVFEPDVYDQIAGSKVLFTTDPSRVYDEGESAQKRLGAIIKPARREDCVMKIISKHFPNVAGAVGNNTKPLQGPSDADLAHLRVCHPDCFDRYFLLSLPEDELLEKEVAELHALLPQQEVLTERLLELHQRGMLSELLNRWMNPSEPQSQEKTKQEFMALAAAVDKISQPQYGARRWPELFVGTAIFQFDARGKFSESVPSIEDTVAFALECAKDSLSVFLPAQILVNLLMGFRGYSTSLEGLRHIHSAKQREEEVAAVLRDRIRAAAGSGVLMTHPRRAELIRFWAGVEDKEAQAVVAWLDKALSDTSSFFAFWEGIAPPSIKNPAQLNIGFIDELSHSPLRRAVQKRLVTLNNEAFTPEQNQIVDAVAAVMNAADNADQRNRKSERQEEPDESDVPAGLTGTETNDASEEPNSL